tara:strand:- start:843 stop:2570 length:1728 start_codon:yes stop_codon:yes gene_type:complete
MEIKRVFLSKLTNNIRTNNRLFLILLLFLLAEVLINPIGEFPLNDDWAYAKIIKIIMLKGVVEPSEWGEAFFLTQMIWGLAFCKIFGFSFTVLRLSEVVVAFIGVIVFYRILNGITQSRSLVSLGTILLVFNPVFLQQSNTFQSDIPLTVLSLICFYCLFRYIKDKIWYYYIIGMTFAVFAILIKQTGIAIAFAYGFCFLFFSSKRTIHYFMAFMSIALLILIIPIYYYISNVFGVLPATGGNMSSVLYSSIFSPTLEDTIRIGYYIINTALSFGIFVFPLTLVCIVELRKNYTSLIRNIKPLVILMAVSLLIIIMKMYLSDKYLPFSGNIIYDIGLGPIIMTGIDQNIVPAVPKLGRGIWLIISFIGALGFIAMIYMVFSSVKLWKSEDNIENRMIKFTGIYSFIFSIIYIIPFIVVYANIRYTNVILPYIILLLVGILEYFNKKNIILRKVNYRNVLLLFSPLILFGILATHDYLSFQRERWKALNYLIQKENIPVEKIDGGFEFNEWHFSHIYDVWEMTTNIDKKGRFWPVDDDEYIVTVTEIEGYDVYKVFKYKKWLPFGEFSIKVLKRNT